MRSIVWVALFALTFVQVRVALAHCLPIDAPDRQGFVETMRGEPCAEAATIARTCLQQCEDGLGAPKPSLDSPLLHPAAPAGAGPVPPPAARHGFIATVEDPPSLPPYLRLHRLLN